MDGASTGDGGDNRVSDLQRLNNGGDGARRMTIEDAGARKGGQDQEWEKHMVDLQEIAKLRHVTSMGNLGQHSSPPHRKRSSINNLSASIDHTDASNERVEEAGQAGEVLNFFRQVNGDVHLRKLKRMGSDGVRGCSGFLLRALASCSRPPSSHGERADSAAAAVRTSANDDVTPSSRPGSHFRSTSIGKGSFGVESLVDDIDSDEEDGDEDAEVELSAQVRCVVLVALHACTVR
ncbi:unnamed protein product [Ectocarpus sp. 12 AP-2014]